MAADHEIGAILTLRDNMSATLRGVRGEQSRFRQDTTETQRVVREPMNLRVNAAAAGKAIAGVALAAGAAVMAVVGLTVSFGDDLQKSLNGVQSSTGVADEMMGDMKDTMLAIYNNNFGENFEDIGVAMGLINQQTGLTDKALQGVTESAIAVKDTFSIEVADSIKGANNLMKQFGMDGTEAYNLIAQGAQWGLDANGDLVDTLKEYSGTFKAQGFSAEEMFNMLSNASASGIRDLDLAADAIKEFGIRSVDGSKGSAEGFEALGLNAAKMTKAFATGGDTSKAAFTKTTTALLAMKDPVKQTAAGVALFGTQFEDMGIKGIAALVNTQGEINKSVDALGKINAVKYNTAGEALEGIKRNLLTGLLLPIEQKIMPKINELTGLISTNMPKIKNEIEFAMNAAGDAIMFLKENMDIIVPAIAAVTAAFVAQAVISKVKLLMDAYKAATIATTTVQWLLNAAMAANPFGIAAVAIGLLVAAGVALWMNWDTWGPKLKSMWIDFRNTIASGVNHAIDLLNKLRDAIGLPMVAHVAMITAPSNTTGVGSNQRMSGAANGTDNWSGGPLWVGEKGPEILDLPKGSRVIPNNRTQDFGKNAAQEAVQDIKQNVIPFKSTQATDVVQNVRQSMMPVRAEQPESLTQDIKQNVIPFDGYIAKLNKDRGQKLGENRDNGVSGNSSGKGGIITIGSLANTLVVREDADIDKIVDQLEDKLLLIAANMPWR